MNANLRSPNEARALFSENGTAWADGRALDWSPDETVIKIVIGKPAERSGNEKSTTLAAAIPTDFAHCFPRLTHLYLWGIGELQELPFLPASLKCLDVRGCPQLASLPPLPAGLETLVIENCPDTSRPERTMFQALIELSIRGCHGHSDDWLHAVLKNCPQLRKLDVSDCPQLTRIVGWAPGLVDVRMDDCTGLKSLPAQWPRQLRRLGLRSARAIVKLPDFPATLDYVDLAHTESLRQLPPERGRPRTLFLFGSGIAVPPASEHGAKADENVAARTRAYFEDVALTGRGEVKRCKLLILGNGTAGKTCLSLAITGRDPAEAQRLGSTHGVQFWDWDFTADVAGSMEPVHLHLWDFGGQEIYHNTHRLFMSKGAVFVVVWNPDQDGKQPDAHDERDYQDEWRPLQYWLDFIHLACPHKPRIALVCSHHARKTDALEAQWRAQVRPQFQDECQCFYIDSVNKAGDLGTLEKWLQDEVGGIIAAQGVAVPTYWEIAQDLVESWVQRLSNDAEFAANRNHVTTDAFQQELDLAIRQAVANDREGRYAKLKACLESGEFELNPDRLRRTLGFLTHSGWLYWDGGLFGGRVIVGQQWALDGLYTILERKSDSPVYRALMRSDGRFTLAELGRLVWDEAGYSTTDQQVLLTLMEQCGLCFLLCPQAEAWREENVYVSFEHLPTARELRLQREFDTRLSDLALQKPTRVKVSLLHKQHWQSFLADAGNHYGKDARYAQDGFYLENKEGQKLLILCHFDKTGLGGEIEIQVGGPDAAQRQVAAINHVQRFLPGGEVGERPDAPQNLGQKSAKEEVFITYAWNPPASAADTGIPPGYEDPVNAIETFLKDQPVTLFRDRSATKFGDNLRDFMLYGAGRQHVIVVHSDKYWRSPDCIFELKHLFDELLSKADKGVLSVVIPVEHLNSNVTDTVVLDKYLADWRRYRGPLPKRLGWTLQELKDFAVATMRSFSDVLSTRLDLNLRWQDGEAKVLAAIAERLNLTEQDPND